MTFATTITLLRILLVPVFVVLAIYYGKTVAEEAPNEAYRWFAVGTFTVAALSDGIDGWIARRFNQQSQLGAILDPIADKLLVLSAIFTLSLVPWGQGWSIPIWFSALVIVRDLIILGGILILRYLKCDVQIRPHWSSKICTFLLMVTLGWVMLKLIPFSPLYPTALTSVFLLLSGYYYIRQGITYLQDNGNAQPQ